MKMLRAKWFTLSTAVLSVGLFFMFTYSAFATTWNAVVDDTFNRSDTSTGSAGSTTGVGNGWIDVAGGIWNIGSNKLQGTSSSSSDYLTKFLVRPSSENSIDEREVATIPAGENFGQFLGVILRYQSATKNHYLAHISSSGIFVYKIVGGATTAVGTASASLTNTHSYSIDFSAIGTNTTALSVVVTDLTTSTVAATYTGTDNESTLQGSGAMGLSTWYNSGTTTTHVSRVQTYTTNLMLSGSATFSGTSGAAMPITDLQIVGSSGSSVPVKLFVSNGTLAMSTVTGLTFTGGQTGSTLYFSGSISDINAALATLTYTRTGIGSDTLEVSLVNSGEVFFSTNGHLYKFISGSIDWNSAYTAAQSQTAYGVTGYLATITSSAENNFVAGRLVGDGWFGASDSATEGDWKWVTGPEAGTSFWSGAAAGHTVNSGYANWSSGEPNDYGTGEDCAQFYVSTGMWNDLPCTGNNLSGYVVEFGTPSALPTVTAKNISITTSGAPTLSTVVPADNAINITTNTNLTLTFSTAVYAGTGTILIKKSSDNSLVESIAVGGGQVTGLGTNTVTIDPSTTLSESTGYYVTIASGVFVDGSSTSFAGVSGSTTWNFTTGDFTPPTLTSVTTTKASGAYTVGETVPVTLTFSEAVTSTGSVTVTFETGSVDRTCALTLSATTTGTCTYTVQAGDTTSALTVTTIAGVIKDTALNAMTNYAPALNITDAKTLVIDTTAPVLTESASISPRILATTTPVYFFSANETGTYTTTNCSGNAQLSSSDHTVTFSRLSAGQTYTCSFYLTDAAGNASNTLTVAPFLAYVNSSAGGGASVAPRATVTLSSQQVKIPLDVVLAGGAAVTTTPTISVAFNADVQTVRGYVISLDPTFAKDVILPYTQTTTFTIPSTPGTYTVYVKYYSTTGTWSDLLSKTITLSSGATATPIAVKEKTVSTVRDLARGMTGKDVVALQHALIQKKTGLAAQALAAAGATGFFGTGTKNAVIEIQKAQGILPASGVVGAKTRTVLGL